MSRARLAPGATLAADLGGTKIAVARVSAGGRVSGYATTPTPAGGRAIVDRLAEMLATLLPPAGGERAAGAGVAGAREAGRRGAGRRGAEKSGVTLSPPRVAVSIPGLAYPNGDVWAPNLPGWRRMPLGRLLRRRLRLPVLVESDRNAFIAGEVWRGAARGASDAILLAVGTGIGAGIWSGGRLLRGHAELSGSVGWMALRPDFLPGYRRCGGLESHAAGPALARAAQAEFGLPLTASELAQRARRGDAAARRLLRQAGEELGRAMANLVSILNPQVIVLSGGVAAAGDWLLAPARRELRRWAQPLAARQVRVRRSTLGPQAALLGAARLARLSARPPRDESTF